MTKTTIIKNINNLLEAIEDKEMLETIYELLENYRNSKTLKTWDKLNEAQKNKILAAYSESENDENLIPMDKVIKH
ncbi:MAG: hypothetical protein IPH93_13180 [Saprospiraceae bacterium]|nr:hypothetical protein [Saprospiraceae bacterium]MBK7810722.1 hypothetical protein [Saprospiraceae bacterium]MBK9631513.1 hypothetical protein [Saprospiraceae bacterium]